MADITTTDVARSAPPIIPPDRPMPEARDTTVKFDAPEPKEAPASPATETVKETVAPEPKVYKQDEVDKIMERVRKNSERRTRAEVRAFYEGRESAAKPAVEQKQEPAKADKPPVRDDFPDWDSFAEARSDYVARKAVRDEQERIGKERKERESAEARSKRMDDFRSKTKAKFADIDQRIEAIGDVELSSEVADEIASSEWGPEIMNHFIDNRQDLERISKLTPTAASRELGRLEARFESAAKKPDVEPTPKPASAAPAPIEPVSGGKTAVATARASEKDDMVTFAKKRNAEEAARRGLTA